jgi:CheY-like chemotaxis protein
MTTFSHVLLADDDPDDLAFFCAGMRRFYPETNILTFHNGGKLLEYLDNPTISILPHFILMDYKMPPLTAPEVLRAMELAPRYHRIPKMVWSTSQRQKEIDECLSLGAVRFVVKPITDCQLDDFIRSFACWITNPGRPISAPPAAPRVIPHGTAYV